MSGKEIEGTVGKIEILHWHVGDDIRLSLYGDDGNSVYFTTNRKGTDEWINALSGEYEGSSFKIYDGRGVAEFISIGGSVIVDSYDIYYPGHRTRTAFSSRQVNRVILALKGE